jgi:hypothetical protein
MTISLGRALMAVAAAMMGEHRRSWSIAMEAEYAVAAAHGQGFAFASGCLMAAWRELLTSAHGRFALTSHAVALSIMVPMGALQIGCALFGLPYLFPGQHGLVGALLQGSSHEVLVRSIYLRAIPALALIQLMAAFGHLRLAWDLLEGNWIGTLRWSMWTLAAVTTLVLFMTVLFLDSRQALIQVGIVLIEMLMVAKTSRWHAELRSSMVDCTA